MEICVPLTSFTSSRLFTATSLILAHKIARKLEPGSAAWERVEILEFFSEWKMPKVNTVLQILTLV